MSYALRHLSIAEHTAGRLEAARRLLEESVRLRREVGFLPGVAANLVGLIYIAAAQGRRDEQSKDSFRPITPSPMAAWGRKLTLAT